MGLPCPTPALLSEWLLRLLLVVPLTSRIRACPEEELERHLRKDGYVPAANAGPGTQKCSVTWGEGVKRREEMMERNYGATEVHRQRSQVTQKGASWAPVGPPVPLPVAKCTSSPTTKSMPCTPEQREVGPPSPNCMFTSHPWIGFIPRGPRGRTSTHIKITHD